MLYPLKFNSQLKERVWGGDRLAKYLGMDFTSKARLGESWELSAVQGNLSVVTNGFLAGNTIEELIEVYMADLVGDKVYKKFGIEFPLLIKLVDTADYLSVQVHPDDEMAKKMHHAYGKTEMWYVLDSSEDSKIVSGFNKPLSRDEYIDIMREGKLEDYLKYETVSPNDIIFIPSGSIHSLGKNIFLVEIQQTSDLTYRIYDWNRKDVDGSSRELHTNLAVDAINFEAAPLKAKQVNPINNQPQELLSCRYFTTNRLVLNDVIERDLYTHDSFRIYLCTKGSAKITCDQAEEVGISTGELVLVPAEMSGTKISPVNTVELLEIYID
ncbi:MAG: type I phosphomannose isomerase catalytic subunit [Bacteroidales bacterium]